MQFRKITAKELPQVSYLCLWGISRKQREAMKEAMERRVKWIEEMMSKGLQIVVALGSRGGKKGLIEYLPIEMAPEPVKGTHSLFIDCIWVLPPYWERGIARGLMECFLEEAEKVGGATVLAYEADRWFGYNFDYMPASFFRKLGFEEVSRDGIRLLLHLDLGAQQIPTLIPVEKWRRGEKGKTVLDVFCNSQCPWCGWMADNIKRKMKEYSGVTLNIINTDHRETVKSFGIARGVAINGEPIIKRMAAWNEVKSALDRFLNGSGRSQSDCRL